MKIQKLEKGYCLIYRESLVGPMAGWAEDLVKEAKKLKNFGILSALILGPDGKIFWHGGSVLPNNLVPFGYHANEEYYGQRPGTRECDVVPFFCAVISEELLNKFKADDILEDDIFEAANYCLQAIANGYKVYATDKVVVKNVVKPITQKRALRYQKQFYISRSSFANRWGDIIKKRAVLPVCYHTGIGAPTGFAGAARGYIKGLSELGIKVFYKYLFGDPLTEKLSEDEFVNEVFEEEPDMQMPQVIWAQAPYFFKNSGKYKIGHCEFEGDEWPDSWVKQCNMMNEIWVPTKWDRNKAIKAGVNVPIHIIYQGIDPDYFHPNIAPMQSEVPQKFKFIVNAAWLERKNLSNLIRVFCATFKSYDDVCLIIKTMNVGLVDSIEKEIKKLRVGKDTGWVYVREENLPYHQLASFYRMGDCFVLPTHGEAWGLPIFEALACGIPVITTAYGAPNEVLRDENKKPFPGVHFLDYNLGFARDKYHYLDGKKWASPNLIQLGDKMKDMWKNGAKYKEEALIGSQMVRDKFNWIEVCKPIAERLQDIYQNKMNN